MSDFIGLEAVGWDEMTGSWWGKVSGLVLFRFRIPADLLRLFTPW